MTFKSYYQSSLNKSNESASSNFLLLNMKDLGLLDGDGMLNRTAFERMMQNANESRKAESWKDDPKPWAFRAIGCGVIGWIFYLPIIIGTFKPDNWHRAMLYPIAIALTIIASKSLEKMDKALSIQGQRIWAGWYTVAFIVILGPLVGTWTAMAYPDR